MICPNKNDENWKIMESILGETAAQAVFAQHGLLDIANHPYYKENLGKMNERKLVVNAIQRLTVEKMPARKNNFNKIVALKELQITRMNARISEARANKAWGKVYELKQTLKELEQEKGEISDESKLEAIVESGANDMRRLEAMLANPTESDLIDARKIASLWINGAERFMDEDELVDLDELREKFGFISDRANMMMKIIDKKSIKKLDEFSKQNGGKGIINTLAEDIGGFKKYGLDISQIEDSYIHMLYKSVKTANVKARAATQAIADKLESMFSPLDKKYGKGRVYDMLTQVYENGEKTGNMITRVKPEYQEAKFNLWSAFKNAKEGSKLAIKNKNKYLDFLSDNEVIFDIRKLFGDTPGKAEHEAELKSILGEEEYARNLQAVEAKMRVYEETKQAMYNIYIAKENLNKDLADDMLYEWEQKNSPYVYLDQMDKKSGSRLTGKSNGHYHLVSVAKSKWNDPKYQQVNSDPEFLAYYREIIDIMESLSYIIPEDKRDEFRSNSLPFIEKDLAEKFNAEGLRTASQGFWDNLLKSTRSNNSSTSFYAYQDPNTGMIEQSVKAPDVEDRSKVNEVFAMLKLEFKDANGRDPSQEERNELYREARKNISDAKSFDFNRVITAYALAAQSYAHKGAIEDQVKLIEHHIKTRKELERSNGIPVKDAEGNFVPKSDVESFKNTNEAVGNFMDVVFYNKAKKDEGVTKTAVLTKDEKVEKEKLEKMLTSPNLNEKEKESIQKKLDELGGNRVWSKIGDKALGWVQLKAIGWNALSAFSNVGFGTISNYTHAAGGEDFNTNQFNQGWVAALNGLKGEKKLKKLMAKFDVLKESSTELGKPKSWLSGKLGFLNPYEMNKQTEYMNQAPVLAAMMIKQNLWDKFDADGNWIGENEPDLNNFKLEVDHVIKSLHGNYDPDSPMAIKASFTGRAITQFRSWMFESFYNRMGEGQYDELLEGRDSVFEDGKFINKKGRYRSYKKKHFLIVPLANDIYKAFKGGIENDVDAANMRKNAVELAFLVGLTATLLMLSGGDDDDKKTFYKNLLVNQLLRLQTDITFYVSPTSFETLTKQSIPAMSLMTDTLNLIHASVKLMAGDDELKSGKFAGDSRFVKNLAKWFPVTGQIYKGYAAGSQVYNK